MEISTVAILAMFILGFVFGVVCERGPKKNQEEPLCSKCASMMRPIVDIPRLSVSQYISLREHTPELLGLEKNG